MHRPHTFDYLFLCTDQAYDQHLNMILGDVEETVTTVELDEETFEEIFKVCIIICGSEHGIVACTGASSLCSTGNS